MHASMHVSLHAYGCRACQHAGLMTARSGLNTRQLPSSCLPPCMCACMYACTLGVPRLGVSARKSPARMTLITFVRARRPASASLLLCPTVGGSLHSPTFPSTIPACIYACISAFLLPPCLQACVAISPFCHALMRHVHSRTNAHACLHGQRSRKSAELPHPCTRTTLERGGAHMDAHARVDA